jgi:hypothetical protein
VALFLQQIFSLVGVQVVLLFLDLLKHSADSLSVSVVQLLVEVAAELCFSGSRFHS